MFNENEIFSPSKKEVKKGSRCVDEGKQGSCRWRATALRGSRMGEEGRGVTLASVRNIVHMLKKKVSDREKKEEIWLIIIVV
jgi:hypothetical protein